MLFVASLASLALRGALAIPFFVSGLAKWDRPLELSAATFEHFERAQLNIFGNVLAMPSPEIAAWASAFGEILIPVALVIGFATRLAALGTLVMTIGVFFMRVPETANVLVSPSWAIEELPWAAMSLGLIAYGAGRLSFDFLIARSVGRA